MNPNIWNLQYCSDVFVIDDGECSRYLETNEIRFLRSET